jgi:membrane-associated phospholipid phosphatase
VPFMKLLQRTVVALLACAALVTLCYFFVDEPFARFVHDQNLSRFEVLKWLTYTPAYLENLAPVVLVLVAVRRAWGPLSRLERTLLCAALALLVAEAFRESLAILFGRYWPETWVNDNPSLIRDGAYGFHPFHTGPAYESFPSGHTARICAAMTVVWVAYPGLRWVSVLVCLSVVVGLLGMDYHFVGDVVAGAFVGSITGAYAACFGELSRRPESGKPAPT